MDLIGVGGSVSSMGYPQSYNNRARCQWNIQVPLGKLVHLHFHNFSLEESQMCLNDKVILTDTTGRLGVWIPAESFIDSLISPSPTLKHSYCSLLVCVNDMSKWSRTLGNFNAITYFSCLLQDNIQRSPDWHSKKLHQVFPNQGNQLERLIKGRNQKTNKHKEHRIRVKTENILHSNYGRNRQNTNIYLQI